MSVIPAYLAHPWGIGTPTLKSGRKEPYIGVVPPGSAPIALSPESLVSQHNELLEICKAQEAELQKKIITPVVKAESAGKATDSKKELALSISKGDGATLVSSPKDEAKV